MRRLVITISGSADSGALRLAAPGTL